MKKFLAITTSLCAAVAALGFGGTSAFAETGEDNVAEYYPATFEAVPSFSNLEDYALGNGKILFLQENVIYEYGSEEVVSYDGSRKAVSHLYFESDKFYYETNDGKIYALENFNDEEKSEDFTLSNPSTVTLGNFYYFPTDGKYYVLDQTTPTEPSVLLDGYANLKRFGDAVYAVKENVLYTLNGTESTPVKVQNFEITNEIAVGGALEKLTASAAVNPEFVSLKNGAYMTEVDLNALDGNSQTFLTGATVKVNTASTPAALLLYTAGNATEGISVISVDGKTYLIHPKDTTLKTVYPFKDSEFTDGTATEGFIYSAPYESKGTRITTLPYGASVKIISEIKRADNPELDHDFYYVEYTVDEKIIKGYVRFGLLSTYTFNEDPPVATPDPEETYEDLIKPVVLILLVLLLVAIAAGYLIYVGTSDKRKKKKEAATTETNEQNK